MAAVDHETQITLPYKDEFEFAVHIDADRNFPLFITNDSLGLSLLGISELIRNTFDMFIKLSCLQPKIID